MASVEQRPLWCRLVAMLPGLSRFGETRTERIMRECGCCTWCPACDEPLNDQAECIEADSGVTLYRCRCGHVSQWLFGPVPILLGEGEKADG